MFFDKVTYPSKNNCCGCNACIQICPKQALSTHVDDEGFVYPELDELRCIDCGLCEKVCPIVNADKAKNYRTPISYAAYNKNHDELLKSSSGGTFTAIAKYVINNKGIVVGAAFDVNFKLKHMAVESEDGLEKLRGSKYIQSDNSDIYKYVREQLKSGRMVYYVGSGCQVAGLKLFLRKDYENLITSDLVCHGVPSQKAFDAIIKKFQDARNVDVIKYSFRDKKVMGWSCSSSSSSSRKRGSGTIKYFGFDPILRSYFNAFISASNFRECCYTCPFSSQNRCGDITLADYWGITKHHPDANAVDGISAVVVNTNKGETLISKISDNMNLIPTKIEWIVQGNLSMRSPMERPKVRDDFYKKLDSDPVALFASYEKDSAMSRIKYNIRFFLNKLDILKYVQKIRK